jgi:outer membrane protein assembly factor BamA
MRSLVILTVLVGAAGYGVFRQLPEGKAEADTAAPAPAARKVEGISLDAKKLAVPVTELRTVLSTHTGDALDRTRLERDRTALENELVSRGYLAAQVASPQIGFDENDGAFVTFPIAQGPLYHVHAVAVTGATAKDAGVVTIASGEPVEADRLSHAKDALAARLTARGKRHSVEVKLTRDDRSATVDVELAAK